MNFAKRVLAAHWFEDLDKEQQRKYLDRHPNSNFGSDGPAREKKIKVSKEKVKNSPKSRKDPLDKPLDLTDKVTYKKPNPKNSGILNKPEYLPSEDQDTSDDNSRDSENVEEDTLDDSEQELNNDLNENEDLSDLENDLDNDNEHGPKKPTLKDSKGHKDTKDKRGTKDKSSKSKKNPKTPKTKSFEESITNIPRDKKTLSKVRDYLKQYKADIAKEKDPEKKKELQEDYLKLIKLNNIIVRDIKRARDIKRNKSKHSKGHRDIGHSLLDLGKRILH